MKRWTIVALANKPYLPHIKKMAETLKRSGTNAHTCFTLVNCTARLPVDEVVYEKVEEEKTGLYMDNETYYSIWGKPRTLRRIINRGDSDYVIWIDADSYIFKNLDAPLELMENFDMCSKAKVSTGRKLTGIISMACTKKMADFCTAWENDTYAWAKKRSKPWSSSQRTMNKVLWPRYRKKISFWGVPGHVFDIKWRENSYIWNACGVDDRAKFEEAWKKYEIKKAK